MHGAGLPVAASITWWLCSAAQGRMALGICTGMNRWRMMSHLLLGWRWHRALGPRRIGIVGIAWGTAQPVLSLIHGQAGS